MSNDMPVSNKDKEKTALVPLDEKQVDFYGDQVVAVMVEVEGQEQVYVPVRPLCEYLGLTWSSQYMRLKRDPVLSEALRFVLITRTNLGGRPDVVALPLPYLPGWLFGINASRVKPELREKVLRYQRECFEVLWRAFQADALARIAPTSTETTSSALIQIRGLALAIAQMAEQQIALEGRVEESHELATSAHARMDRAAEVVAEMRRRLTAIESRVAPTAAISDEQAAEISSKVKALAELLTTKDPSKNYYQSVFAELYRRFGVSSYKLIRQEQCQAVLKFLEDWRKATQG